MIIQITKTKNLCKFKLNEICKLKNSFWNFGLIESKRWFIQNIKKDDFHILLFDKKKLIGYIALRDRFFVKKKKLYKYYLFDTLIIKKKYRKLNLSKVLMKSCNSFLRKKKKPAFLICKSQLVEFYENFEWKKIFKSKFNIEGYKNKKKINGMAFNLNVKTKLFFYIN